MFATCPRVFFYILTVSSSSMQPRGYRGRAVGVRFYTVEAVILKWLVTELRSPITGTEGSTSHVGLTGKLGVAGVVSVDVAGSGTPNTGTDCDFCNNPQYS